MRKSGSRGQRSRRATQTCTEGRTDPDLWAKVKAEVTAGNKGGNPGQWSARKAQLAVQRYKSRGGTYCGPKTKAQKSLTRWTQEDWGSDRKGDRYLPKAAREALTKKEYKRTSAKKRRDTAKGKQFSAQPRDIAKKTSRHRRAQSNRVQKLDPVMDPAYNLREVYKQCILLEDHLANPRKRCQDCISKHCHAIEALVEEARGLDKRGRFHKLTNSLHGGIRKAQSDLVGGRCPSKVAQDVRAMRKQLNPLVRLTPPKT